MLILLNNVFPVITYFKIKGLLVFCQLNAFNVKRVVSNVPFAKFYIICVFNVESTVRVHIFSSIKLYFDLVGQVKSLTEC